MDCQYIQQNEIHEKYLLSRLSEAETSEYESHIKACDSCREELAKQKTVIAGIQAVGRHEMKQQIRKQVEELREQPGSDGSKWQMILKIAAVLFIIALIPSAIYYFRTDSGEPMAKLLKPESAAVRQQRSASEENARDESLSKKGETEPPSSQVDDAIEKETIDRNQQYADAISEQKKQIITPAPKVPTAEAAPGGSGQGYGAARIDTKQKKSITLPEASQETSTGQMQAMQPIPEEHKNELLSKLSLGNRFKYAETEKAEGESVRFDTEETTARKYNALTTQELARDYRSGKQSASEKEMPVISTAVFKSGQKLIKVNFVPSDRELILNKESNLPQSFDVDILDRDSVDWKMNWYLGTEFIQHDPSQMEMVIEGPTLYVIIPQNNIYKIATDADTTKAILLEK